MIIIRETTSEIDISGSPDELGTIADEIERLNSDGTALIDADTSANTLPYNRCLRNLDVRATQGPVRISVEEDRIIATGSLSSLSKFASFFRFAPSATPGTHHHHEWFDGNAYIAKDSRPLVISVR
jgi:hypothetical protein